MKQKKAPMSRVEAALKKMLEAEAVLKKAAPKEWGDFQIAEMILIVAKEITELKERQKQLDAARKAAAPDEWTAYKEADRAHIIAMKEKDKAAFALSNAAPVEWAGYRSWYRSDSELGMLEQYKAREKALKRAAPAELWRNYQDAVDHEDEMSDAYRNAFSALKKATVEETMAYEELSRKIRAAVSSLDAPKQVRRVEEAILALKRAAPGMWKNFREMTVDSDVDGIVAAKKALSRAASDEWAEYRAAKDALGSFFIEKIRNKKMKRYVEC